MWAIPWSDIIDLTSAKAAVNSPLLETSIEGANAVLLNVTAAEVGLMEANEAAELIREHIDSDANIIFGVGSDESLGDDIKITVIATGFDQDNQTRREVLENRRSSQGVSQRQTPKKPSSSNPFDDIDLPDFLK